jgi:hypothetical protein
VPDAAVAASSKVHVELLGTTPALGDAVGVEQQRLPGGQQVPGAVDRTEQDHTARITVAEL